MLFHEVAARLEKRLGLGEFPLVRRRLYARLQRLCLERGDPVLAVIAAVVEEAYGPKVRDKGQYFCWVIKRRLAEQLDIVLESSPSPASSAPAPTVAELRERVANSVPATRAAAEDDLREKLAKRARDETIARLRERVAAEGGGS